MLPYIAHHSTCRGRPLGLGAYVPTRYLLTFAAIAAVPQCRHRSPVLCKSRRALPQTSLKRPRTLLTQRPSTMRSGLDTERSSTAAEDIKQDTTSSPSLPSLPLSLTLLNVTTVLWGTQHAVIKLALVDTNPSTLNFARFLLAALISLPALPRLPPLRDWARTPVLRHGGELSLYLFAGYALQSAALLTTSASRSAFLLYLNVKLVPLLARVLYGRAIAPLTWVSAGCALLGTVLLTYDGSPPAVGDVFSVAAAAASALFILRTEAAGKAPGVTPAALNAVTLASVAALASVWTALHGVSLGLTQASTNAAVDWHAIAAALFPMSGHAAVAVVYLGVVTTALCNYLQAVGQKGVSAERAAVVFAMDPVYGALFAWLMLGETLGPQGFVGAFVILGAAVLSGAADSSPEPQTSGDGSSDLPSDMVEHDGLVDPLEKIIIAKPADSPQPEEKPNQVTSHARENN